MTHPIFEPFRRFGESDLGDWPILRYWKVTPRAESLVVAPYNTGEPAILERTPPAGQRGRVLLWTTAAHYQAKGPNWSELPLGWSYVVLADQIVRYLSGTSSTRFNFETGEVVEIDRSSADPFTLYAVSDPAGDVERITVEPRDTQIRIPPVQRAGSYRVDASQQDRHMKTGFSANVPAAESQLEPIPADQIVALFEPGAATVARDPAELERVEGSARVGRELFPWIMLIVAVVATAEGFLANRFYRSQGS
jgi:hypothetical protein